MAKKKRVQRDNNLVGGWAFLIGVIIALILGLIGTLPQGIVYLLVIIGIIVGLLNIADRETKPFLFSGIVLIIASALGMQVIGTIPELGRVLEAFLDLFVPAVIIVAIRNVLALSRS